MKKPSSEICGKNYLPINNQVVTGPYRIKSPSRWGQTYLISNSELKEAWWHKGGRVTVENPRQPRHKGGEKLSMKI